MNFGTIYIITNDINNNFYIGQTYKDLYDRLCEHYENKIGFSILHEDMKSFSWQNFSIKSLEENISLDKLDEREKYWKEKLHFIDKKHEISKPVLKVQENNICYFEKDFYNIFQQYTSWNLSNIKKLFNLTLTLQKDFHGYYITRISEGIQSISDKDVVENWIKTLLKRFNGKHILCYETFESFSNVEEVAYYFIKNRMPQNKYLINSLISEIKENLTGKLEQVFCLNNLSFVYDLEDKKINIDGKIFCPELNYTTENIEEMGEYLSNIKKGKITKKTAVKYIKNVILGIFDNYNGLTFQVLL